MCKIVLLLNYSDLVSILRNITKKHAKILHVTLLNISDFFAFWEQNYKVVF